jgi:multiple sugar transport system ATP-binding protein
MAEIRVEGVDKLFGTVRALEDVDLVVLDQEFVVLLGPSGCGKTTLLRIIAGLESATAGTVRIGGRDVSHLPPRSRRISMVFQNYAVFPHLTVYENVAFGLRMQKVPRDDIAVRVERAAGLMHIEPYLTRYPSQLSGGQRQRVAVARALAVEPEVLLMDEPLSNLDALLRLEMRAELKRLLQGTGTTTLYVTHDQVEAMSLADRIAVMRDGRIVQYDVPLTVYSRPSDRFVGGFIGNPPMNFLRLEVDRRGDGAVARLGEIGLSAPRADGGTILLGLRPEDLEVRTASVDGSFSAEVHVVEPLGPHLLLTVHTGGQPLKITAPPDLTLRAGDTVWLRPIANRLRWMDPASGAAIETA